MRYKILSFAHKIISFVYNEMQNVTEFMETIPNRTLEATR